MVKKSPAMLNLPTSLGVVIVGSFGRAPHSLLAALPCELHGTTEITVGVPSVSRPSALWRSAGDAVLRHAQYGKAGPAFDAWHHLGVVGGTAGSRFQAWRQVLALDDRQDPVVQWWLNGGQGAAPEPVFPLV